MLETLSRPRIIGRSSDCTATVSACIESPRERYIRQAWRVVSCSSIVAHQAAPAVTRQGHLRELPLSSRSSVPCKADNLASSTLTTTTSAKTQHPLHSSQNHPLCFSAVPPQRSSSAPSSALPPTAASPSLRDNVCQPNAPFRDLPTSEEGDKTPWNEALAD
jgi:hypothetical protein